MVGGQASAEIAAKERAERQLNGEEDDHDRRRLKPSERLRKAAKQKAEGNELFKGKVYDKAAVRYIKALQVRADAGEHCPFQAQSALQHRVLGT